MDPYQKSLEKLYALESLGIQPGLDNIKKLISLLGNPQGNLKFIHVAGTNGKGSVCAILSKALESAGLNTGLFTSPHLVSIRERFRFNNSAISRKEFSSIVEEVWPVIETLHSKRIKITFFEATVAIALKFFVLKKCDFVIWETGMGGRFDATSVVNPIAAIITTIGLDHQNYLGDTLEKIAYEKAGIIKKDVPLFLGNIPKGPLNVIDETAGEKEVRCFYFDNKTLEFTKTGTGFGKWQVSVKIPQKLSRVKRRIIFELPLHGDFQIDNMRIVYCVLTHLSEKYAFDLGTALRGLAKLQWHARIQILPDGKILDGAHNMQGIEGLISSIKSSFPKEKFTIIFGCLEERNPKAVIIALSEIADRFIFVPVKSPRKCFAPKKIVQLLRENCDFAAELIPCRCVKEALDMTKESKTLITGSLYLAGEVLSKYYKEEDILKI